jgi:hypothetical protein
MIVKIVGTVLLALLLAYAGASAFSELRLIRLAETPEAKKPEPVSYNGRTFYSPNEMAIYIEEGRRNSFHPWTRELREPFALIIIAISAGYFGGLIRLLIDSQIHPPPGWRHPYMGAGVAVALLALGAGYEAIMTEGEQKFRPLLVVTLSFVAGVAWEAAWTLVGRKAAERFKK